MLIFPSLRLSVFLSNPHKKDCCCQNTEKHQITDFTSRAAECRGSLSQAPPVDTAEVMGLFHLAITLSAIVPAAKGKACCDISNKMSGRAMWHCSLQHQGHHRRDCSHCNLFPEPVRSCLPAAGSSFLLQVVLVSIVGLPEPPLVDA